MSTHLPITANDYYDTNPENENRAGDIWVNLPTYGLLGTRRRAGIVITPPCDLAQGKVETITYLPIINLATYFSTMAFSPLVMRELRGQLESLLRDDLPLPVSGGRFTLPSIDALIRLELELSQYEKNQKTSQKEKAAAAKAISCVSILRKIGEGEPVDCESGVICSALGYKSAKTVHENLVKNSHAIDLHFLPADGQPKEWSAIEFHSLVLFRYPITAPVELFDEAQELGNRDWHSTVSRVAKKVPAAAAFSDARPMKRAVLKSSFFSDLLTRYAAMHVRVGSPDFTSTTVAGYISDLGFSK